MDCGQNFDNILGLVEDMSPEDQDALFDVIRRRRSEKRRREIVENVRLSREEFMAGRARTGTIDELMEEFGR